MTTRWVAATLAILVLSACTAGESPTAPPSAAPTTTTTPGPSGGPAYVALGDSYTAGPGITGVQPGSGPCLRSDHNYPTMLARDLGMTSFRDASCAGATTTHLLERTSAATPAQLDAITAATTLVTVGIGGNDGGLFTSLLQSCANQTAGACASFVESDLPRILADTEVSVAKALDAAKARAPRAQVILVGYLRLAPDTTGCPALPLPATDVPQVVAAEEALDAMLAEAARDAGVEFLSMRKASTGHDVCSGDEAWANGAAAARGDGVVFHPNAAGMRAVAAAIEGRVRG